MKDEKVEESMDAVKVEESVKVEGKIEDGKVEDNVVKMEESMDAVKVEESVVKVEESVDALKVEESVVKVEESVDAVKVDGGENEKNVKVDGGEMLLSDMMQEIIEKKKDKVKVKVQKVEKDAKDGKDKVKVKVEEDSKDGKDKKDKVKDAKDGNDGDDFQLYNTPPKGSKTNDPLTINPLQKFDDELLVQLENWLKDVATNDQKKTVYTCEAPKKLFVIVLTKCTWLKDPEVDAFCHLLRKRIAQYPKTYKHFKVSIGGCLLGDLMRHMPEWPSVDDIYVPLNIGNKHWVLCIVRLQDNHIDVYDCDSSIYRNLDPYLRPLCEMIPRLFAMAATDAELQRFPKFNFQKLTYKRLPHPAKNAVAKVGEVPRATESGDCGVFMLMYMEYLTAGLGVEKNLTGAYVF
ncbi:uncharacterized protein LOC124919434 [Impatiens glandulifera]|uniref:uncharacterized protein LOC124919434 n=1 Tax=Impatiens glandulifera TaxID=253017 RepID=UPI001FB09476|nr:uncharacterized protein LOC124919434 [Impatiens glandulifera]